MMGTIVGAFHRFLRYLLMGATLESFLRFLRYLRSCIPGISVTMLSAVLKPLLLLFRYPRFSSTPSGPHPDIGAHTVRIPGATACQIFYPAANSASPASRRPPYFRPDAVAGLADATGVPASVFGFLSARRHPCARDAAPAPGPGRFPLVLFSHGLFGSMETYTALCRDLASHGFVVAALDHEDGSGHYARSEEGRTTLYVRPDDTPYSRAKVLRFRGPMHDRRVGEIRRALEYLSAPVAPEGGAASVGPTLAGILARADVSDGAGLLGHSFGGATAVLSQQRLARSAASVRIGSVAILDPWCFSLPEEALDEGVSVPLLSVLSSQWPTGREFPQVVQCLESSNTTADGGGATESLWAPRAVHQSFSDTYCWLPGFVTKRMGMRGKKEKRHETVGAVASACAVHFRRSLGKESGLKEESRLIGASFGDTLLPFPLRSKKVE